MRMNFETHYYTISAYYCPTAGGRPLLIQRRHEYLYFRLILIISPGFLTIFSFTDVSDDQDKLKKYICIEKDTLVLARI